MQLQHRGTGVRFTHAAGRRSVVPDSLLASTVARTSELHELGKQAREQQNVTVQILAHTIHGKLLAKKERPHEALEMSVPAEVYELSSRSMPDELAEHEYPDGLEVRRVQHNGCMKWKGKRVFVSEAMRGESIGLGPIDDGVWHVHLGPMHVGVFQERAGTVVTPPCDGS